MTFLYAFFESLWGLTVEMAPYLLLGFFFAGILHVYFPKDKVNKYLGKRNAFSVVNASLLGIPLPLCSCGVIPTGVSFHKNGAGKGATVSFLISTPQTGVDSIMATYALLGLPFALIRPFVALVTGIFGGLWANTLPEPVNATSSADAHHGQAANAMAGLGAREKVRKMFRYAFLDFLMDISKWLLIGLVIAALVAVILPDDFFTQYIGNDYLSMLLVLAASVPMYVCATGSVPIAAVLLMKGLSPGAAMVFLMAGPATNAATMTVIGNAMGKRTLLVYMASIIAGALFFGTLVNEFLPASWFQLAGTTHLHHHEGHFLPHWLSLLSAVALVGMLANGYILRYYPNFYAFAQKKETTTFSTQPHQPMEPIKIQVNGMTCNHCKASVEKNVGALAGIQAVKVELAEASVLLTGEGIDLEAVKQKVEDIGFEYVGPMAN